MGCGQLLPNTRPVRHGRQGARTPVSATLRSVCRKAQTMESMTSLSCPGDMVKRVPKQALVIDRNRLKNCSRCSG